MLPFALNAGRLLPRSFLNKKAVPNPLLFARVQGTASFLAAKKERLGVGLSQHRFQHFHHKALLLLG